MNKSKGSLTFSVRLDRLQNAQLLARLFPVEYHKTVDVGGAVELHQSPCRGTGQNYAAFMPLCDNKLHAYKAGMSYWRMRSSGAPLYYLLNHILSLKEPISQHGHETCSDGAAKIFLGPNLNWMNE